MPILDLKDRFKGKSMLIVGCGPSVLDYPLSVIEKECEKDLILCMKSSYSILKDLCDIHVVNDNNLIRYKHTNPPKLLITSGIRPIFPFKHLLSKPADYHFKIDPKKGNIMMSKNLSLNEIHSNSHIMALGPGILYECVIPLVVLTGIKHLKFLGIDLSEKRGAVHMEHFYQEEHTYKFINPANPCAPKEIQKSLEASMALAEYLDSKNITYEVLSKNSFLPSIFPRKSLQSDE